MAIAENGPQGRHRGRIGNMVYYTLNGQNIGRKIGRRTKPPTEGELRHHAIMKLVPPFLKKLLEYINLGFSAAALGTTKNAYNLAMEANFHNIVAGAYPNLTIDYPKVILSQGILKPAHNPLAELVPTGIKFSWNTNSQMDWLESSDQAMMLAYFPEEDRAVFRLFGKDRLTGTDLLVLPEELQEQPMYTYLSFISEDRKQQADSIYTGAFNLGI